jgi:hypothetical protein
MARNNWANEAFRKAQNLMSKGYNDFEPTSVVTKQELNNLKTALLSDEQIAKDNEQQPEQWYKFPGEDEQWASEGTDLGNDEFMGPQAKTTPYVGEEPVFGKDFDLDTVEQDAIDYEEKNAYRNKDPDRPQSDWDRFAAPDELTENEYRKKQGMLAIQAIQKQIENIKYGYFTKMTPGEREQRDARIAELERERNRLMELYRARDWAQGTPNEEARKKGKQLEQYAVDNKHKADKGQKAWEENKHKLDPNFVGMIEETIPGLVDDAGQIVDNVQDIVIPGIKKDLDKAMNWIDNLKPLAPFTDAMKKSESSGDYKSVNTKGYMGAYQFGEARLSDYKKATGKEFTKEEFLGNKKLQDEVFDWHVDDIKKYMSKTGLDSWVGKKILGVEVTIDGLVAVAHLGGKAGLKKFLESNGEYNPADSYGTTLKDYLRKFGK